ncbi:HEAT repeat domain-containing protein [Myxococcus sp. CA040A]|uniref:HEAT repeat domain-containing protein n=1 Tax=Myxococcus sp. CA040A TaxID=2741738 RepID=UPI00211388B4|nr:HEAT repeat domain-containing protein [Myxococcus sp. CA040A]
MDLGSTPSGRVSAFLRSFGTWVDGTHSARVQELIERLAQRPYDDFAVRDLAELGPHARHAGGVIVEHLASEGWDMRITAALALGLIQYAEATDALIAQLEDGPDWRRVHASARALGLLYAERAIESLERIAARHWYPPVKEAASQAVRVIRGEEEYPAGRTNSVFFAHEHAGASLTATSRPFLDLGPDELPAVFLAQRTYSAEVFDMGEYPSRVKKRNQRPQCGLRVSDGYLLGASRGEWGGELVHQRDDATETHILYTHVVGIHRLGPHIIVATGLAHLGGNTGRLYRVFAQGETFDVEPWRQLPGAPQGSGWLADGRLYISCFGGAVLVSPEGDFEMADSGMLPAK